jgi:transposase
MDLLYLPPYTCELNPIEQLWGLMKKYWRKEMMKYRGKVGVR